MVVQAHTCERRTTQLALRGQLSISDAAMLRQRLIEAVYGSAILTIDLTAVERIDLACLQLLYATRRTAQQQATPLRLVGLDNPSVVGAVRLHGFTLGDC